MTPKKIPDDDTYIVVEESLSDVPSNKVKKYVPYKLPSTMADLALIYMWIFVFCDGLIKMGILDIYFPNVVMLSMGGLFTAFYICERKGD